MFFFKRPSPPPGWPGLPMASIREEVLPGPLSYLTVGARAVWAGALRKAQGPLGGRSAAKVRGPACSRFFFPRNMLENPLQFHGKNSPHFPFFLGRGTTAPTYLPPFLPFPKILKKNAIVKVPKSETTFYPQSNPFDVNISQRKNPQSFLFAKFAPHRLVNTPANPAPTLLSLCAVRSSRKAGFMRGWEAEGPGLDCGLPGVVRLLPPLGRPPLPRRPRPRAEARLPGPRPPPPWARTPDQPWRGLG